jgi:hypothetical protein
LSDPTPTLTFSSPRATWWGICHADRVGRQLFELGGGLEHHPQVGAGGHQRRDVVGDDDDVAQVDLGQRSVEVD